MNGSGPSPNYMDLIAQTFGGAPPPGAGPVVIGTPMPGAPPMPPPPMVPGPNMSAMPPPAPPPMSLASTPPPPPAPAPPPPPMQPRPFLQQVGAAGIVNQKAKETELRGPQLLAAQGQRNNAFLEAVGAVTDRSQQAASSEFNAQLGAERAAHEREDAANYSAAERAQEMAERQADFDQSARALSKQAMDPNRFWSTAGAGQKIAALIGVTLGGFGAAASGGRNTAMDAIQGAIDRDLKAQEFAFNAARDATSAKQTAFSMAMQKYNNVDAARASARAAALDAVTAQMGQQAALWKGTDAANRASMATAALQDERMQQIAQGVAFTPARQVAVGASYIDPRTGMRYSEQEAKGLVAKMDEREFAREQKGTEVAGQLMIEGVKSGAKANDKVDEGAKYVSSQLQQAGVPQARTAAERALKALNESEGGMGEAIVRGVTGDKLGDKVMGAKAAEREQSYSDFVNSAIKATMGNATESEQARAMKGLGSIGDPAARRRAIEAKLKEMDAIEKNAQAGASPEAQRDFAKRRMEAEGGPPAAPKGSKAGW